MKTIFLLFIFWLSMIPNFDSFSLQKENSQVLTFQTQNDYFYTDEEIIKEFYQPVADSETLSNGFLILPKMYDRAFKFQFAEQDLNLIWKESLKTRLEFDLKLFWDGQMRNEKLETHLSQFLDLESMEKPLTCGTIPWESKLFPTLKFNPVIKFSWIYDQKSLILEHKINSPLDEMQSYFLVATEHNGLVKMFFEISHLKLIYEIPSIFNQISQINLSLEFWADLNSVKNIDQLIGEAILNDLALKSLKFVEYFENPILTSQQKESLLNISDNFQIDFQFSLQLRPKYQEEIFAPLLKKLFLKISFSQLVDLNQLQLNSKLKVKPNDDPDQVFLNQNLHYKFFFENCCLFQVNDNYLLIEPKAEYHNLCGTLNLPIEYEEVKKTNLKDLNLEDNLGKFELDNPQQILQGEEIFKRWKELNDEILSDEKITDYSIKEVDDNHYSIRTNDNNQCFEGSVNVYLQKKYSDEKASEKPDPELKKKTNFFQKYWWILVLGTFGVVLIAYFIWKSFKDKKHDKS